MKSLAFVVLSVDRINKNTINQYVKIPFLPLGAEFAFDRVEYVFLLSQLPEEKLC